MVRLFKYLALATGGALAGAILGIMIGLAYMEFAQHGCVGTVCADLIARTFIPGGALAGAMAGFLTARPLHRFSRF